MTLEPQQTDRTARLGVAAREHEIEQEGRKGSEGPEGGEG